MSSRRRALIMSEVPYKYRAGLHSAVNKSASWPAHYNSIRFCIGIDVQIKRGCAWFATSRDGKYSGSGWIDYDFPQQTANRLRDALIDAVASSPDRVAIGIDAPGSRFPYCACITGIAKVCPGSRAKRNSEDMAVIVKW
ncbi:MAG: hypothetical protein U5R06_12780 [candidate division KSB1 bacterium]|nr:hypothetical protein [candidate division KSB1 bacterium]